jgi:hypothetical protein
MRTVLLLSSLVCLGCGSGSPFDYVEASGRVAYEDGTTIPAGGMRLLFTAQDAPKVEGVFPRPAVAEVNDKGEFTCVTSYKYCDGVIPGRHKVVVEQAKDKTGRNLIPKEYTSITTTPLVVDTEQLPFEIKIPKPQAAR